MWIRACLFVACGVALCLAGGCVEGWSGVACKASGGFLYPWPVWAIFVPMLGRVATNVWYGSYQPLVRRLPNVGTLFKLPSCVLNWPPWHGHDKADGVDAVARQMKEYTLCVLHLFILLACFLYACRTEIHARERKKAWGDAKTRRWRPQEEMVLPCQKKSKKPFWAVLRGRKKPVTELSFVYRP